MTQEEIVNLAKRCSRKIWEICMEEPGFSTSDCPEGANVLSDIVLNVILKEFPAIKKCSSLPSNLDEAANKFAVFYDQGTCDGIAQDCFKAGAEWMAGKFQKIEGDLVDWYSTSDGKDYCCGVKTDDSFEVPEGFYIKKKQ